MKSIEVLTLFPEAVEAILGSSILKRAQASGTLTLKARDLRPFGVTRHNNVDDTPFGGGPGMLFRADVLEKALLQILSESGGDRSRLKVLYPSPRGLELKQSIPGDFAGWLSADDKPATLVIVCGRYEGVDERFLEKWVDFEFSLGDFVVTGGELPALCFVDALVRLLPGVLGDERSSQLESFNNGLLEHPQYTKPREALGREPPEVLLGGHHAKMDEWKLRASLQMTAAFRPDLIRAHNGEGFPRWAKDLLAELKRRCDERAV